MQNKQTQYKETEIGLIPEDWEVLKFDDVLEITSSKRIFMSDYVKSGIPFYRGKEIIEKSKGAVISTDLFISEEKFDDIDKRFGSPKKNDILLSSVGTIGVPYLVDNQEKFYFKDGNLTWFKNYSEKISPKFLYYWIISPGGKQQILGSSIGSTQQALTIDSLKRTRIALPPFSEQQKIAEVLGALDDKIELNRKINKTLESLGQAIFKRWFMDFEETPKGWEIVSAESELKIAYGKNLPTDQLIEYGYPVYGGNGIIGFHSKFLYVDPQIIIACRGAACGALHKTKPNSFVTNNSLVFEIPNSSPLNIYFLDYYLKSIDRSEFITGSAQPQITVSNLNHIKILKPEKGILDKFENIMKPVSDLIFSNDLENQNLSQIRDSLLPRLMSGKLRIG